MKLSPQLVFILHLTATFFMFGVIWFVQLVHYPLMREIGSYKTSVYEFTHLRMATWVFAPPMLLEAITGIWLIWEYPEFIFTQIQWVGLGLLAGIWLTTLIQASKHQTLAVRFDEQAHKNLVRSNWIRTLLWSLRVVLLLFILVRLLTPK